MAGIFKWCLKILKTFDKKVIQYAIKTKIFWLEMMKTTFWVKVEFVFNTLSVIYKEKKRGDIIFGQK